MHKSVPGTTSTKQRGLGFLLKETTGAFHGSWTHGWQASADYESDTFIKNWVNPLPPLPSIHSQHTTWPQYYGIIDQTVKLYFRPAVIHMNLHTPTCISLSLKSV